MSLRDYFAASSMAVILSAIAKHNKIPLAEGVAKEAYEIADAMLAEREK